MTLVVSGDDVDRLLSRLAFLGVTELRGEQCRSRICLLHMSATIQLRVESLPDNLRSASDSPPSAQLASASNKGSCKFDLSLAPRF